MPRRSLTQRLEQLDAQKKSLQARLGKQERAHDTRRKILLGALVLQRLASGHDAAQVAWLQTWLRKELPAFLTRDTDKALLSDLFDGSSVALVDAQAHSTPSPACDTSRVLEPA
jgi:hypothetical protein